MSDTGAKAPAAGVNSAMLASMADHSSESHNLASGSKMPSHEGGESHHPFMQDQIIHSKLGQSLSGSTLNNIIPTGQLGIPGVEPGGVLGEQAINLGNQELAKVGHDLGGGLVGIAETSLGDLGSQFNIKAPQSLSTKGKEQGH